MNAGPDPQMAAILARLQAGPAFDFKAVPIDEARREVDLGMLPWSDGAPAVPARTLALDLAGRTLRGRLYEPEESSEDALTIFVHGGGWTFGSIDTHDGTMRNLAAALNSPVLGVDYRLAPEHPFPAPLNDVLETIALAERGAIGRPRSAASLAIAGDSAGANLALAALIARRDAGLPTLSAAALFYGCYAPDFATPSHAAFGGGDYLLTTANMRWYWANFLGGEPESTTSLAAPLRANLDRLPPIYLAAAGLDPLRDDTLMLAKRLADAGAPFRCDHFPGVVHGCLRMTRELDAAGRMIRAGGAFITSTFNKNSSGGVTP